ncbi:MAG: response regulator [Desulfosarcinaceae bacterium]|jgi:CheY-like chemotaxis protein
MKAQAKLAAEFRPGEQKILVVDDNTANIDVMMQFLEPLGYELAMAVSGEKALRVAERFRPDLILLDVMMPGMDGFETCRRLKAPPLSLKAPVIFVTAKKETEDIVKGFQYGGVDYVSKPIRQEEVASRIETHLRLRHLICVQARLIDQLQAARGKIKILSGLLPICAYCKKIRDDQGYWHQIETYIHQHSDAEFSHGLCEACAAKLYPDLEF